MITYNLVVYSSGKKKWLQITADSEDSAREMALERHGVDTVIQVHEVDSE